MWSQAVGPHCTWSSHSHTHLRVVDQVLQWVSTGEEVFHLLPVGDGSSIRVLSVDNPRDIHSLHTREVREQPRSHLLSDLLNWNMQKRPEH